MAVLQLIRRYCSGDQPFDVVLLDVALGEGPTGHDVARLLRRRRDVVQRLVVLLGGCVVQYRESQAIG